MLQLGCILQCTQWLTFHKAHSIDLYKDRQKIAWMMVADCNPHYSDRFGSFKPSLELSQHAPNGHVDLSCLCVHLFNMFVKFGSMSNKVHVCLKNEYLSMFECTLRISIYFQRIFKKYVYQVLLTEHVC
jgi:hypothetical protein